MLPSESSQLDAQLPDCVVLHRRSLRAAASRRKFALARSLAKVSELRRVNKLQRQVSSTRRNFLRQTF